MSNMTSRCRGQSCSVSAPTGSRGFPKRYDHNNPTGGSSERSKEAPKLSLSELSPTLNEVPVGVQVVEFTEPQPSDPCLNQRLVAHHHPHHPVGMD